MIARTQMMFLGGFIGLSASAVVLIGGVYVITGGAVGALPTLPMLMLAGSLFALRSVNATIKADGDAR